jgi:hypothetical protein
LGVITPVLRALGWDDSDPEQVIPEYASGGRRVDFALCGAGKRPSLFIEVKGVGRAIEGDRQLFEYAFHEGIPLCLLTDGREWSFFLPGGQGSYDERRVYRLQLDERPVEECTRILTRYLSRDRIKSGDAFEDAMRDYRDIASRREAKRRLPEAWLKLVEEPEDLLVELLSEQTEALSGYRPTSAEVSAFLMSLKPTSQGTAPATNFVRQSLLTKTRPPVANPTPVRERTNRQQEYTAFGSRNSAPNAAMALVEILTAIANRHPEKLEEMAMAVRGRSRNHIARTVAEIYPARPDLARAVEFAPGWLVGLNIANREKLRILKEVCRVTGLRFGSDIAIDLPNADA